MDIYVNHDTHIKFNYLTLQKMGFIYNALEDGWEIKKEDNRYFFIKKHEGKKEVFSDNYLKRFLEQNFDVNKILSEN